MDEKYVREILATASERIEGQSVASLISGIAKETKDLKGVSLENQYAMGAILGSMLHQSYCDGRRLEQPNENGLANEPRIKELNASLDRDFVLGVLEGRIEKDSTLYVEGGKVFMDIANRNFSQLSPHWQYDNFMAGCCAARSVLTNWEGLTHDNEQVREFTTVAVANGIHEAWIARGNVGDWNADLATAYVNLPVEEQDKDLGHYVMASGLIDSLRQEIIANQNPIDTPTE